MTIFKNIRLGLLHIAVAITFVAINGVLNRIMIHDLGILSTVVAGLVVLPYFLSPAQVWMGQYSDTHPFWGYRRTSYILLGILLCVGGMVLTPFAALLLAKQFVVGLAVGVVAFQRLAIQAVLANPQARLFFVYFILLMVAILGQDVLLEPFGAYAFGMSVGETTQLTALWGGTTLIALLIYGFALSRWLSKKRGATLGGVIATIGLLLLAASGLWQMLVLFRPGIAILGFGTGIATATNLGLMLDMTTTEQAGLYIGVWGVADAIARGIGMLLGGIVRDMITWTTGNVGMGYITVFCIEAIFLLLSLALLAQIDAVRFRSRQPTLMELAALSSDA